MTSHSEDFIPTRYSLLSRLKDWNDQDSWEDFFDSYWHLIYAIARNQIKSILKATGAELLEPPDILQD